MINLAIVIDTKRRDQKDKGVTTRPVLNSLFYGQARKWLPRGVLKTTAIRLAVHFIQIQEVYVELHSSL